MMSRVVSAHHRFADCDGTRVRRGILGRQRALGWLGRTRVDSESRRTILLTSTNRSRSQPPDACKSSSRRRPENADREAATSARRTPGKTLCERRQWIASTVRSVTCTACSAACFGRRRCGTPGRRPGVSFRPAPCRRPPQVRGAGSASRTARRFILILVPAPGTGADTTGHRAPSRRRLALVTALVVILRRVESPR